MSKNLQIAKQQKEQYFKDRKDIRTVKKPTKDILYAKGEGKITKDMVFDPSTAAGGMRFSERIIQGMLKDSTFMPKVKRIIDESKKELFGK